MVSQRLLRKLLRQEWAKRFGVPGFTAMQKVTHTKKQLVYAIIEEIGDQSAVWEIQDMAMEYACAVEEHFHRRELHALHKAGCLTDTQLRKITNRQSLTILQIQRLETDARTVYSRWQSWLA